MLSLGGHDEYGKHSSYKEWKDKFVNNILPKHDMKCNEIKNSSLKKEDKIKLLNKLKDKIETTLLIIQNQ